SGVAGGLGSGNGRSPFCGTLSLSCRRSGCCASWAATSVPFGLCATITVSPLLRSEGLAASPLRVTLAPEGIVSGSVLSVLLLVPWVIVSLSPDSEEKLPRSIVMVSTPPFLFGTTFSEGTGGPAASASGRSPNGAPGPAAITADAPATFVG